MNKEKEIELFTKYKQMFVHKDDPKQSCMTFGFATDDGWTPLIETLLSYIDEIVIRHNEQFNLFETKVKGTDNEKHWSSKPQGLVTYPQIAQVKEKFGGLRFYTDGISLEIADHIRGAIDLAERLSFVICEKCGNPGKIRRGSWVRTLCDNCAPRK